MKILFLRHGQSIDDIEDRYGGWADFDLTEKGREQALVSAKKIDTLGENFETVLSSPLKRALQTAEIISGELGVELEVFEYLKERNLNGILTGMTRTEAMRKYTDAVKTHSNYEYVDGSERDKDFDQRVKNAIDLILKQNYKSVVAVTHGLFIKVFFKEILNTDIEKVGDGGFVLVEEERGKFKILHEEGIEY